MKTRLFTLIVVISAIVSCSSWKTVLVSEGDVNDAVRNAITDFMHTCSFRKKDSIFSICIYEYEKDMIVISIMEYGYDYVYPFPEDKIGCYSKGFPSRYSLFNGKLFHWIDSTYQITQEIVDVLEKYNHIDSINVDSVMVIPYMINDYAKSADYFFCRNNLRNYKKVVSRKAYCDYPPPELKCNKNKSK